MGGGLSLKDYSSIKVKNDLSLVFIFASLLILLKCSSNIIRNNFNISSLFRKRREITIVVLSIMLLRFMVLYIKNNREQVSKNSIRFVKVCIGIIAFGLLFVSRINIFIDTIKSVIWLLLRHQGYSIAPDDSISAIISLASYTF